MAADEAPPATNEYQFDIGKGISLQEGAMPLDRSHSFRREVMHPRRERRQPCPGCARASTPPANELSKFTWCCTAPSGPTPQRRPRPRSLR